ncbi:MAG TPA: transposase [Thermoguttaceae bacterium]|nr:transposase [Thermoguttaceae bacterium]
MTQSPWGAVEPVLDALEKNGAMPEEMLADTAYGSDANVQASEEKGVELVSPTPGKKPEDAYAVNSDDFVVDETTGEVEGCPCGEQPLESSRDESKGETTVVMGASTCEACAHRDACPVRRRQDGNHEFRFTDKQRRLDSRRREEETEVFRERYRKRSGIEATNSILKRVTGLGRLRVRGSPGVFHSILLKVAGWNLLQAARALAMRQKRPIAVALE